MDILSLIYLLFCLAVCILGIVVYVKRKNSLALFLGIAYGFFTIDRFIVLLGVVAGLDVFGIVLRVIAYLLILFALYKALVNK